jgi:predicted acylesterase/phospholipase RssA
VFISYTGEDLSAHADAIAQVVTTLQWVPVDHRNWPATGRPSVAECRSMINRCDVLVVLVAYRYGWVPTRDEGGDGFTSITWLELQHARAIGIPILPFLVDDDYPWLPSDIEERTNPGVREPLETLKAELRRGLVNTFRNPAELKTLVAIALPQAVAPLLRALERGDELAQSGPLTSTDQRTPALPVSYYPDPSLRLADRLRLPLPKRVLAIDSGGIRTAATLGPIARIEAILRARYGDPYFTVAQYFDLIGGVGTGAAIGALLATGMDAASAAKAFRHIFRAAVSRRTPVWSSLKHRYQIEPLMSVVDQQFGEATMGSDNLRTGLCILTTSLRTLSTKAFTNHPDASSDVLTRRVAMLVAAAIATPTYLPPVDLNSASGDFHVDASLSIGTDPSLLLFGVATSPMYPFRWRDGEARLLLVSTAAPDFPETSVSSTPSLLEWATLFPTLSRNGAAQQARILLSRLGARDHGGTIAVDPDRLWSPFVYRRIESPTLAVASDDVESFDRIRALGDEAALVVQGIDLPAAFDVRQPLRMA